MLKRIFAYFVRFVAVSLVLVGGFFYTQGVGAQQPGQRPDFKVIKASFDGLNLHVEYINATGIGYPARRYEVGFRWYDGSGNQVGVRHWLPVPEVARGGVSILDSKSRIELSYRSGRSVYGKPLWRFIEERPSNATELRVIIDDYDRIAEEDERNNTAVLKIPLPDLQITGAKFLSPNKLELSYRNANPSPIPLPFRIGFTWAEESGRVINFTRFMNVLEPALGTTKTEVLSRTDVSYINDQGRQVGDRLDQYFDNRPVNATRLKITIDDAGTVREGNEQNNLVSVRPDLPDLVISDARLTTDALTFTARNIGLGSVPAGQFISFWFEWVNHAGGRVSALVWNDVPTALAPGQFLNFDASRAQFRRERATGGLSDPITFDELMASAPESATHLKVRVDGPSTYAEPNEQNNVLLLPKPISPQPDLAIADLRVGSGNVITFGIQNSGEAATGGGVSLWFHGATAGGVQVGPLYWYDVPEIQAGQTQSFNSAGVTVRSEAGDASLSGVFTGPSTEATHFKILLDGPGRVTEKNEGNNMALMERPRPPLPDIAIENAVLTNDRLTYAVVNRGNAPIRVAAYNVRFEWLRADGQLAQGHPYPPVYLPSGSNLITGAPGESLRFSSDPPDARYEWLFRSITDPPMDAVRLRLTADPTTPPFEESNEENNVVILERPRPVLPEGGVLPDFSIENAALSYASRGQGMQVGQLIYTIRNRGSGVAPHDELWVGHRWVGGGGGQPLSDTRYMRFVTALQPNGVVVFDSIAQRPDTRGWEVRDLIPYPPLGATHFELTIDPWGYYRESAGGAPNTTRVDIPRPDFTFSRAQYAEGRLTWELMNNGAGIPLGRRDGYQWLTDFPIRHEWLNTAGTVLATQNTFVRGTITNGVFSTFDSNTLPVGHPFRAFFATPPAGAAQLRITVDPERVQQETDENNNTITRAVAGDEPEVPPMPEESEEEPTPEPPPPPKLPDLRIADFTMDPTTPRVGERVWFIVRVENVGNAATGTQTATGITIDLNNSGTDRKVIGQFTAVDIASEKSFTHRWTKENYYGWVAVEGTHTIEVCADRARLVQERDETNNCARKVVTVSKPLDETTKLPDFSITGLSFSPNVLALQASNKGGSYTGPLSVWFHFVDDSGVQQGPLFWADLSLSPNKLGWFFSTAFGGAFLSNTGKHSFAEFLQAAPQTARSVKIIADGPNRVVESDEQNNTAQLALSVARPQPDLALTGVTRAGGVVKVTIVNNTSDTLRAPLLQFKWLDAKGAALQTSPISYWQHETIAAGKTGEFTLEYEKWREDGVVYFLKHPPAGTVALLTTIDPENKLKESNEENNSFRMALGQPDLAYGTPAVRSGALIIPVINQGGLASAATDIWLQWYGGGKWLPSTGAVDVSAVAPGATVELAVPLDRSFGADGKILADIPSTAERLRLFLDGSRKVDELNEQNNTIMLERAVFPKITETVPLPDLAFNAIHMAGKNIGKEFFVVSMKNVGTAPVSEFVWQMRWLDRSGKTVGETYQNIYEGLKPNWNIGATSDAQDKTGKPMAMGEFVSLPPEGAVLLEALLDPDNRIAELNEQNNRAIIAALALEPLKKERPKLKPEVIQEKPDLTVDGAGFLPLVDIIEKDRAPFEAVFSAIVSNKGKQESGAFRARVRVDNGGNGTWEAVSPSLVSVPTLAVGEQTLIKLPLEWKAAVGTYTFEICVDPGKNIDEANESNNCATDRFTLKVGEEPAQEEVMIEE